MSEWTVDQTRVKGNGHSFNCLNKITATELCNILNNYEKTSVQYKDIDTKLDKVQKTVIQLQLTCGIMSEELQKLHKEVIQ